MKEEWRDIKGFEGKCCKGIYKMCDKFHWQYIET